MIFVCGLVKTVRYLHEVQNDRSYFTGLKKLYDGILSLFLIFLSRLKSVKPQA